MSPDVIADSIVNLCGGLGLATACFTLWRRDANSPLTSRLLFALGIVALLFLLRGLAWWSGSEALDDLALIPAALIPLGALIVTEGLLRRHAPRALKLTALIGGLVLGLAGAFGPRAMDMPYAMLLSAFQLAGFAVCAVLLAARDRTSLLGWENRAISRIALGAVLLIPFVITDFRTLAPEMPVRLGALGALLVVTAILIAGASAETQRQALWLAGLRLVASALLGAAAASVARDVDAAQVMRYCAVAMSAVLTIGLMTDALRAVLDARQPGVLGSIGASRAASRADLIAELMRQPIFESARRYREDDLAAYDPPLLRDCLAEHRVLRRADAPWGRPAHDPAVERIVSLMAATGATHVLVLSHQPVDLIVLAVSVIAADPATETALTLVQRLLVLTPEAG